MLVGVLALQGCIDPHIHALNRLGLNTSKVRTPDELRKVDALILPGGESSTMLKLIHKFGLYTELILFGNEKPTWGVCAGSILLAHEVTNPEQDSLGLLGVKAHRNFYGSQLDSFEVDLEVSALGDASIKAQFIRAPRLEILDPEIEVLATHNESPVLVKKRNILASTFHTELSGSDALHAYFVKQIS